MELIQTLFHKMMKEFVKFGFSSIYMEMAKDLDVLGISVTVGMFQPNHNVLATEQYCDSSQISEKGSHMASYINMVVASSYLDLYLRIFSLEIAAS